MTRSLKGDVLRLAVAIAWAGLGLGCGRVTAVATDAGTPVVEADTGPPAPPDDGGNDDAASVDIPAPAGVPAPPPIWTERAFEHSQVVELVAYNDDVAIYFDRDVTRAGTDWLLPFLTSAWRYTKSTYGDFKTDQNDGRFYAILHEGKYQACHVGYYNAASFEYRNGGDCAPGPWGMSNPGTSVADFLFSTMAPIAEYTSNHVIQSVARNLWSSSLQRLLTYDLLLALDRTSEATAAYDSYIAYATATPRPSTFWFRDWLFPLWRDHGHEQVIAKFLKLVSQHFVAPSGQAPRTAMTLAEMVHFMSGAAGVDLKAQAVATFGADNVTDPALGKARLDFPQISY